MIDCLDSLPDDEWLRIAAAPATYRYDCHANILCGVECTMFVGPTTTFLFPFKMVGYPEEQSR